MAHSTTQENLVRGIRRWDLVALVVNSVIGAGIFGLPGTVYKTTGTFSLLAFVVCAAVVVLLVLCFAEVTSRFSHTGGPYLYAREVFPPVLAFQVGWLLWLTRLTAFAAISNLLVTYLAYFWPEATSDVWRPAILTAVVLSLMTVNIVGVRSSAIFSNVFTVGKMVPLLLFIAVGMCFVDGERFTVEPRPEFGEFSAAVLLLIYAFTGFEIPVIAAGEVTDPRRNFPFALLAGIVVVVLVYVLIQIVCIGTLPELASSKRPLADAASRMLGSAGASIITLGALISMTGTLSATLLAGSRMPFALAEQRQLPHWLMRTHPRFHTPHVSIVLSASLILVIAFSGTFEHTATLSAIARLFTYAATCVALILLRRRSEQPADFQVPGGVAIAAASLALIGWLLYNVAWDKALYMCVAVAAGVVLWAFCGRSHQASSSADR